MLSPTSTSRNPKSCGSGDISPLDSTKRLSLSLCLSLCLSLSLYLSLSLSLCLSLSLSLSLSLYLSIFLRVRYLVDLFHLEVRRVYRFDLYLLEYHSSSHSISNVCPLDRLIEYGVYSLKTNHCCPRDRRSPRSFLEEDGPAGETARSPNSQASGNSIMTALRILQHGISRSHPHEGPPRVASLLLRFMYPP
jgi:hypothetical protein